MLNKTDMHSCLCARKTHNKRTKENDLKGYVQKVASWFPNQTVGHVKLTLGKKNLH